MSEVITANTNRLNLHQVTPSYLFYKDTHSVFLGCNLHFAKLVGLKSPHEIRGKTDFDLPWADSYAKLYREGDQAVLDGLMMDNVLEPQRQTNGSIMTVLLNKLSLMNQAGEKIGIVGSYREITEKSTYDDEDFFKKILSPKQLECLIYLAKGMTTKRIASSMNISGRTVDSHIEKLKEKLDCYSKQDLLTKVWKSDFIKSIL